MTRVLSSDGYEVDFQVAWLDGGREPQCAPNPAYPDGVGVDVSFGTLPTCCVALPYPAPRCGLYRVKCSRCEFTVGVTTAGRPDDPRSVVLPCNREATP